MAKIFHPTSSYTSGPFLIDRAQLESLDSVVESEWTQMVAANSQAIDEETQSDFQDARGKSYNKDIPDDKLRSHIREKVASSYPFQTSRSLVLTMEDGRSAKIDSFAAAFRDPALSDQRVNGFRVSMQAGSRSCKVTLNQQAALEIEALPSGDTLAEQILTVLKNWQRSAKSPVWLQVWHAMVKRGVPLHLFLLVISLFAGVFLVQRTTPNSEPLKEEAARLVQSGITPDRYGRALELSLIAAYGLPKHSISPPAPRWFLLLTLGCLFYLVALSFCPNAELAIGLGERRVFWWRSYTKLVAITVPLFVFSTFVWPQLQSIITSWFGV